ncbi:MAG: peptidoglycan DD-metalloendopeptidase family protein [Lachnospiraceae bacterium]|nr:peptidoglycan DD-metalloendopeptidase family protein [Lachnospiraceae bacterium]
MAEELNNTQEEAPVQETPEVQEAAPVQETPEVQEEAPAQESPEAPVEVPAQETPEVQEEAPVQETLAAQETPSSQKKKDKKEYHLMLFVDNKKEGGVHQVSIGRGFVRTAAILIALALGISILGWVINNSLRKAYKADNETLNAQVSELSSQVETLTAENTALSDKVTILSNTVNTKVQQENEVQEESDAAHYPSGFPLSASASMTVSEENPNCLIFSCSEGTSIISTGAGKVIEVLPDTDYGYCIRIDHENGYVTEYYTSSTPLIKEGDEVLQGAILALVEGNNTKLAYKMSQDGKEIDPMEVIKIDG